MPTADRWFRKIEHSFNGVCNLFPKKSAEGVVRQKGWYNAESVGTSVVAAEEEVEPLFVEAFALKKKLGPSSGARKKKN